MICTIRHVNTTIKFLQQMSTFLNKYFLCGYLLIIHLYWADLCKPKRIQSFLDFLFENTRNDLLLQDQETQLLFKVHMVNDIVIVRICGAAEALGSLTLLPSSAPTLAHYRSSNVFNLKV